MAGEIKHTTLSARVRLDRRGGQDSPFSLDVSVEVLPGITILFGPSGAGKSTLLDCIAGLVRPNAGRIASGAAVLFDSKSAVDLPPQKRQVAYVFQSLALFPHMTAEANVAYGLANLSEKQRRARVAEAFAAFGVESLKSRKPGEISGGEKQRVALARSLVTLPRVLLLDEPLTGLDAEVKSSIIDDLRAWNAVHKVPIIYVTHTRDEVDALGERVIALDRGRVVNEGLPSDVLNAPKRKKMAQASGFENLLGATVLDLREADGVMRVRLGESPAEIEVPLGYAMPGDRVRVAIRAGDILLATERPTGLSARNVLEGKLVSLDLRGTTVIARVDCGVTFTAHVTPGAVRALELKPAMPVWLALKTHSCHVVED